MTKYIPEHIVLDTLSKKGTRFLTVTFEKRDGTVRTKNGLLKPLSQIKGTGRPTPKGYTAIWSPHEANVTADDIGNPSKGRWGMFRNDKVLEIA